MSYSIALTAASKFDLILYGNSVGGIGAAVWLTSHYVTKAGYFLNDKLEGTQSPLGKACQKVLKVTIAVFEFLKLFALYGAGVGFSASIAAVVGCYSVPAIAILILGSTFAGVYALSQTKEKLSLLFATA